MAFNIDPATLDLQETVIETRRVSKTVKGGRIMRFAAVVVVGDHNGHVGFGTGKSAEVPEAIRKAIEDAKKNMIEVSMKNTSIPHDIIGEFGAARVLLKPAAEGTGIIAGGTVRSVVEMAMPAHLAPPLRWKSRMTCMAGVRVSSFRVMVVARKEVTPWAA